MPLPLQDSENCALDVCQVFCHGKRKKKKENLNLIGILLLLIVKELIPINVKRYNFEKFELCKLQSSLEVKSLETSKAF